MHVSMNYGGCNTIDSVSDDTDGKGVYSRGFKISDSYLTARRETVISS